MVTVCEILSNPLNYDGMFVTVRDRTAGTAEGLWLIGQECPGIFKTEGYVWKSLISVVKPGNYQVPAVEFAFDEASEDKLNPKYRKLRNVFPEECLRWTYTGLFETRKEWKWTRWKTPIGFGHEGGAPGQLIVRSVDDVASIPNCTKDKTSHTP
jgi:hypothetical protein